MIDKATLETLEHAADAIILATHAVEREALLQSMIGAAEAFDRALEESYT
jgi:hypothetical protein